MVDLYKKGFKYFVRSPAPKFTDSAIGDNGTIIVSKYKIIDSEIAPLTKGFCDDCLMMKDIMYAAIQIKKHQIMHLINIHLQAIYTYTDIEM